MKILKRVSVPTGDICIVEGSIGKLECLSIGDYGKDVNLKADFMGLDRELTEVHHTTMLPLSEKWVITISTQYGCDSGCTFCDVPKVGRGVNASHGDLTKQVYAMMDLHPEVTGGERLNIHYARMGEPTWNYSVISSALEFHLALQPKFKVHPVVSTMMPKANENLIDFLKKWMYVKNEVYGGEAGLQLSINSTDDVARDKMFRGSSLSLREIAKIADELPVPVGRKITLNFAIGDWPIDGWTLKKLFDPAKFLCKLTPLHRTKAVNAKGLMPAGDWTSYTPYAAIEQDLKNFGFDVIVFIASAEEDSSRITCGNALLALPEYANKH